MLTELKDLRVLQAVVKHMSYAKAATELRLSPSGVSKQVTRLEERLGVKLFERTTRKLRITPAGQAFYSRTVHLLSDVLAAEEVVKEAASAPSGTLRLSTPVPFGQAYLAPLLGQLLERFPAMGVELVLQDSICDMVGEGIDLVVRIGTLGDSRLVARRLCTNRRVLVASPKYIAERGMPRCVTELPRHVCLPLSYFAKPLEWRLVGPGGVVRVGIEGCMASNNVQVQIAAAEQGLGISVGPTQSVSRALLDGRLVRVLPDYEFEPTGVYALYPSRRQLPSKVRATVDFLAEHFFDPPPWDVSLEGKVPGFSATAQ